ncbi:MAG: hypothetical protein ACOX87_06370 [Chloroflexota bacterium]|jgi:hypothetical protein
MAMPGVGWENGGPFLATTAGLPVQFQLIDREMRIDDGQEDMMERVLRGTLLALALTIGVFVVACAPAEEAEDLSSASNIGRSSVQQGTPGIDGMAPGAMMGTPTRDAQKARATPGIWGTPSPADIQNTMSDMDQLQDQLRDLASDVPTANDLTDMVQQAGTLMDEFHMEIPQMSPNETDLALSKMEDIVALMARVVDTYSRQLQTTATPGVMTPTPMAEEATPEATPTMQETPIAGPMEAQQLMSRIDQLRDQLMRMASGQPTDQSIINSLDSMQSIINDMRQQLGSLSNQDLQALTGNLADAFDDMGMVMDTYIRQTGGATPATTPDASPTATPIPSPTPTS